MADSNLPERWIPAVPPIVDPIRPKAPPRSEHESTLDSVLQLFGLLRRHWLLVLCLTAVSVGVLLYRIRNEPHLYRATATIRLVDKARQLSNGMSGSPMAQEYRPYNDPVLTQIQILQSQAVAESVAVSEGLRLRAVPRLLPPDWATSVHVSPTAQPDTIYVAFSDSSVVARSGSSEASAQYGTPMSIAGVQFTVPNRPTISAAKLIAISQEDAANQVRGGLSGKARELTDVIDVSFTAQDPAFAQRIANAAVRTFQRYSAQTAKQQSVLRRQFIAEQLEKTQTLLEEARNSYNAFRTREKVFSSQDKFRAQQADLANIELRRQELIADRGTYTTLLGELEHSRGGSSSGERLTALAASPGIASNAVVSQLFSELLKYQAARDSMTSGRWGSSPNNPEVVRLDQLIAAAQTKVVNAVTANVSVIDARLNALNQQKATVAAGIEALPQAEATEASLTAQVTTYERQVDHLRDELQSAEIAEAAEVGQVEIVDLARADGVPIGPGRRPKVMLALVLGFVLSTIGAYVLENYRPVIRRRDDLEQALSLPNLALVPQIRRGELRGNRLLDAARALPHRVRSATSHGKAAIARSTDDLVTISDTRSSGAEAYRTLRTNLLFSAAVRNLSRIVITSPGPEEGKSTTAANLAIAFAQQGQRVLLIDCDLRRARVHKIFEEAGVPGLTGVLVGGESITEAIRQTRVPGLNILPAGVLPPNPAELLGSSQMTALLDRLGETYDLLILDTPPLLAASDAAIVSRISDGALVVVRAGRTEKSALQTAVQQLTTVGARVLGTVLNDPDAEVPKYARYYGYYYNTYYEYSNGNGASA